MHVVHIDGAHLDLFAKQKVDQAEESLERLVVSPSRKRAVCGAATLYLLDRLRNAEELGSAAVRGPGF
jgi:hypothetical protein